MNKLLKSIGTGIAKNPYSNDKLDEWNQLLEEIKNTYSITIESLCNAPLLLTEHVDEYSKLKVF
ncbi:MAG: hypothetical protein WCS37_09325 [Chloroflexota bacterium]|nr:hypothetical protein [Chloroflexota bacterium]